eukprot:15365383-Ditylum_brightwellii.AAC.1
MEAMHCLQVNKDLPKLHWKQYGSLAFDNCVIVDKIVFNFHMLQIVGFADDAFDIDVIKAELEGLCKNNDGLHTIDENDEETEKDGDTTNTGKSDDVWHELHNFKLPDT